MTQPSEAAKRKAEELANEHGHVEIPCGAIDALARFIQQVSDACAAMHAHSPGIWLPLLPFILPPDEPDPLEEAWHALWPSSDHNLPLLREELDKRGYEIRRKDTA